MALYFKDTEITNIDNLVPQSGLDITDMWFGSTSIYTVWEIYEGTLPATFNANGDDMRQYQIWGDVSGVGEPTKNLFDISLIEQGGWGAAAGAIPTKLLPNQVNYDKRTRYNQIIPLPATTLSLYCRSNIKINYVWIDVNGYSLGGSGWQTNGGTTTAPEQAASMTIILGIEGDIQCTPSDFYDINMVAGSIPPGTYEPYGYKLDMATGSNILQSSEIEQGGWQATAGSVPQKIVTPSRCRSKNIYQISGKKIFYDFKALNVNIAFIDSAGLSLGGSGFKSGAGSVDVLANAAKCLFIIANTNTDAGITPTQVIAAGIWTSVDATTTPIYIGDDPLDKDEYIDYQTQKVYRMINDVLTPTDPPVPLQALPTCEGTTIVDYAATLPAPEKVLLKYRKEGY